jgi:hypothetical protein
MSSTVIRRRLVALIVPAAATAALVSSACLPAQAGVVDRQRYSFTDTVHERTCGRDLTVVTTTTGTLTTRSSPGDAPLRQHDNYNIHEVLTDASGEGYIIDQDGNYNDLRVRHARGTLYRYSAINAGQVFTIRTLGGEAVQRDRGVFQITYLVDSLGDADPSNDVFLEDTLRLVRDAGKHPLVTETDAEFCAVIDEAVAG